MSNAIFCLLAQYCWFRLLRKYKWWVKKWNAVANLCFHSNIFSSPPDAFTPVVDAPVIEILDGECTTQGDCCNCANAICASDPRCGCPPPVTPLNQDGPKIFENSRHRSNNKDDKVSEQEPEARGKHWDEVGEVAMGLILNEQLKGLLYTLLFSDSYTISVVIK